MTLHNRQKGWGIRAIQELLGQRDISTTMICTYAYMPRSGIASRCVSL